MDKAELMRSVDEARTISREFAQEETQVFTAVLTALLLQSPSSGERMTELRGQPSVKGLTVAEFFFQIRPAQDVDKALAAAYFLDAFRSKGEFVGEELRQVLLEAKVSPPKNVSLAILRNAQRGLIAQKEKQGKKITWLITQTGIEKIKNMSREANVSSKSE
ncbi:MAG TPA: hypothetical protein VGI16_11725 [Candidatus Acidoferrum sp.]|jgi:hypothetical protein